ncbi:hypothetical protein EHP00_1247 [Ecytonucleospora hepatopenaei]|uniref:Uncharacterized protein n=1 Tax=Ecytonucleospora hepatopenaei TaxID=646526 RepID=A0A1W0E3G1_9MICR|nr:hypothetical protein EHP00_1247 [Ecytonucleospora hepatopenaei]
MKEIEIEKDYNEYLIFYYDLETFIETFLTTENSILIQIGGYKIHKNAKTCKNSNEIIKNGNNKNIFIYNIQNVDFTADLCVLFNKNILNSFKICIFTL